MMADEPVAPNFLRIHRTRFSDSEHLQGEPMIRIVVVVAALLSLVSPLAWAQDPNRTYAVGEKVEVRWAGDEKWYEAEILEVRADGQYFIRYTADGLNAM